MDVSAAGFVGGMMTRVHVGENIAPSHAVDCDEGAVFPDTSVLGSTSQAMPAFKNVSDIRRSHRSCLCSSL